MHVRNRYLIVPIALLLFLSGCAGSNVDDQVEAGVQATLTAMSSSPAETAMPTEMPQPTSTAVPEAPQPAAEATQGSVVASTGVQELIAAAAAAWQIDPNGSAGAGGIEGINGFRLLSGNTETPFWVAYSYGSRNFESEQHHQVGVFTNDGGWAEISRIDLNNPGQSGGGPDYLPETGVFQVSIEPSNLWIQVEGVVGAHSGVLQMLKFDGFELQQAVQASNSSPGIGTVADINGDEFNELLIDMTDYYVFCYACGVRKVDFLVYRWDGLALQLVTLRLLPKEYVAENLMIVNNRAVELARAGLWKDALETGLEAAALNVYDATFDWNLAVINLNAEARRNLAEQESGPFPLLHRLFYGDYEHAVDALRDLSVEELFSLESSLLTDTVADGWTVELANRIMAETTSALSVRPNLAPAHFLRGWASWLTDQNPANALVEIAEAESLAPDDALYAAAAAFLRGDESPAAEESTAEGVEEGTEESTEEAQTAPVAAATGTIYFSAPNVDGVDTIYRLAGIGAQAIVADAVQPALQPGGERLAFFSTRSDMLGVGGFDLSSDERLRFSFNTEDSLPTWDPRQQQIIFASTRFGDGKSRLYQIWADGQGDAVDLGFGQDPSWHPTEDKIAFKGCDESGDNCGLWSMRSDGSERQPLTDHPGDSRPVWTRDGAALIFMSDDRDGNWELYRLNVADGAVTRLTNDPANDGLPAVSPDGASVAFMSDRDGIWSIQTMPATGGDARRRFVIETPIADWRAQGLAWE